jgi:hypothetical protein
MNRLGFVCHTLQLVCGLCVLLQAGIDFSYDNMLSVLIAAAGISVFVQYMRLSRPFDDSPLSSLALFGFCMTAIFVSLVSQSLAWVPFVQSLRAPLQTFSMLACVLVIAVVVHYVYRKFLPLRGFSESLATTLITPLGAHDVPRPVLIWCLAPIGYIPMILGQAAIGDVGGKFIQALEFMTWLPFLIVAFHRRFGDDYCLLRRQAPLLALHFMVVAGFGVANNARQIIFIGPVIAALLYMIYAVQESGPMPHKSIAKIAASFCIAGLMVVLMTDLVTGMEIARKIRQGATATQMLEATWEASTDKAQLAEYRDQVKTEALFNSYDEVYLSNPLLNRLSETKFHDNMLFFALQFDDEQRANVIDLLLQKIGSILPQPVIKFFKVDINKLDDAHSLGDVYKDQALGLGWGGYATGSIWADVRLVGGLWWPLVAAGISLVSFMLLDTLTRNSEGLWVCPAALALTWTIFIYGFGGESLAYKSFFYIRYLPEKILLYCMALSGLKLLIPHAMYKLAPRAGQIGAS